MFARRSSSVTDLRVWTHPRSQPVPSFFFFFLGASISLLPFLPFLSLPPPAPPPPPPPPPVFQFIFQFAPRSSQVCARRKFAEAAGAPSEATWRRDRRVTIGPSPPLLYLPLRLVSPPFPSPPPVPPPLSLSLSPLEPACQATQVLRVT